MQATANLPPDAALEHLARVTLLDARVHAVTLDQCVALIMSALAAGRGGWVVTHNLDHLRRLHRDGAFRDACSAADLVVADGAPLVWAARLAGSPLPQRVAGSDLIYRLPAAAAAQGRSIYFMGGNPGTAERAARQLVHRYPSLTIAGVCCPLSGFEDDAPQMRDLENTLLASRPDIVFVALGSPKQEFLIARLRHLLPTAWWLGVGISFSFVCGEIRRAPPWIQRLGLEWLHRLLQEPRRLGRRYLLQGIPFAGLLMADALRRRWLALRPETQGLPDRPRL